MSSFRVSIAQLKYAFHKILDAARQGEVAFSLGLMAILVVLVLPLPRFFLDVCLSISLTFAVVVLMTVLFIEKPLDFSAFPTVLLVGTMLRLSLNVASTRLILSHGHEGIHAAGELIRAFGSFVMGGNFVIGVIIFAILIVINFVVITKGSGRIAEVAARFSLDAMPGKQMSVDADLASGILSQDDAKKKRQSIQDETNFYGAMDGAAKFVRGDAIAGLLIAFINVIGGIVIGVAQKGLPFSKALTTYTVLTVGDGLVSQIPALIISVAAGMLVSKTDSQGSADKAFFGQMGAYPVALGLSSSLMTVFAFFPGIPTIPFFTLGGLTGFAAWRLSIAQEMKKTFSSKDLEDPSSTTHEALKGVLQLEAIQVTLGCGLLHFVDTSTRAYGLGAGKLTAQIAGLRRDLATKMGVLVPPVRVVDDLQLDPHDYQIRIKDIEVGSGHVYPNLVMVMDGHGDTVDLEGEDTIEPVYGIPARWVNPRMRDEAESKGYTVVEPPTVIVTHLTEIVRDFLPDLLSYSHVQDLIDGLERPHQKLFSDLVPSQLAPSTFQRVLQILLGERVSIRDLPTILEAVSEASALVKSAPLLAEHVRAKLARQLCSAYATTDGALNVVALSPEWEKRFKESLFGDGESKQLTMPPSQLQEFVVKVKKVFGEAPENSVLLTTPAIRPYVRSVIERFRPMTVVMSQAEIHPKIRLASCLQL